MTGTAAMERPHGPARYELTDEEREALRADGFRSSEVWTLNLRDPAVLERYRADLRRVAVADRAERMDDVLDAFNAQLLAGEPDYEW